MTNSTVVAVALADRWKGFWRGEIGEWILVRGLRIALLLIGALLAARFIRWAANKITRRIDADFQEAMRWSVRRARSIARRWPR